MSKHTNGYARLLESWTAPSEAGAPIGFIATSFTFSSDFFEGECLYRFLKLESDPDEDGAIYLIEQEEKLASLSSATVLVDQCHAKVRRNLRWDLIPVRLSKGIMHAKISVLFWSNHIRVIIGSANLTPDGYRRNQEIFSVLEAFPGSETPVAAIKSILDYLQAVINSESYINPEIKKRPLELIAQIRGRMRSWKLAESNDSKNNIHIYPLLIRPGGKDLLSQMYELWNRYSTSPVQTVYICSPFYDEPQSENKPAKKVWEILNKRTACVNYYCTGEQVEGEEKVFLHAPETLQKHTIIHSSPEVNFYRVPEKKGSKKRIPAGAFEKLLAGSQ